MNSFRVKNVKSFIDSGTIELAPLTIFVGQNSCGKSSLLRFPVVLSQSYYASDNPILFSGRYVDYGFFEDIVHNHDKDSLYYEFSYDVDIADDRDLRHGVSSYFIENADNYKRTRMEKKRAIETVTMGVTIKKINKRTVVEESTMSIGGRKMLSFGINNMHAYIKLYNLFSNERTTKKVNYTIEINELSYEPGGFPIYDSMEAFESILKQVFNKDIDKREKLYIFEKTDPSTKHNKQYTLSKEEQRIKDIRESLEHFSNIMTHAFTYFNKDAVYSTYIGPFRDAPSRIYRDSEISTGGRVGTHGENVSNMLAGDIRKNKRLITETSKWIEDNLGYKLTIEEVGNGYFQIILVDKKGVRSNISDVGFGVSQVLPVVLQVIREEVSKVMPIQDGKIIEKNLYIEQPELHLHPAAQSKLADLFAECVCKGQGNKIIIETHSEHLIRKLQVLISDKNHPLTSEMVKVYYIDKNKRGNGTVKEMRISQNGKFEEEWPTGFFDQAHTLTMDLLKNNAVIY